MIDVKVPKGKHNNRGVDWENLSMFEKRASKIVNTSYKGDDC